MGSRLREAIRSFASKGHVDEQELSELIKELQRVLIASDVEVQLVSKLSKEIKRRSLEEKPLPGLTLKEHVLKVVYDSLVSLVGEGKEMPVKEDMRVVLLGLHGSGKTTTAGKIGYWLKKRGVEPTLVSLDRDRPAAFDQLSQIASKIGLESSKEAPSGPVIIDTAGRNSLDTALREEARRVVNRVSPHQVFLVIPAEMGHQAGKQAEALGDLLTGVVLTRMDGSAKGGGALSACANAGTPIAFLGTGEDVGDLEVFDSKRYISRLLGWGDIKGLLEKAQDIRMDLDPSDLRELNMVTFYKQMEALTQMGPFEKVLQMVGLTDLDKETVGDMKTKLSRYRIIINSMTKEEKLNPDILGQSRINRIARGSGTDVSDVKTLLKEFKQMRKMLKRLSSGKFRGKLKGMKGLDLKGLKGMKFR